jgi:hypothetical protein
MPASSVSVSVVPAPAPVKPSPPRLAPPVPSFWVTGAEAGSGHSAYGVGLAVLQARKTTALLTIFDPAAVAWAAATVTWVASAMLVITVVALVILAIVPLAAVTGIVSV